MRETRCLIAILVEFKDPLRFELTKSVSVCGSLKGDDIGKVYQHCRSVMPLYS